MDPAYARWRALLRAEPLPTAIVDLDALEHNLAALGAALARGAAARPDGAPPPHLRLATKSLRCPALVRHVQARAPAVRGLLAFHARELALLAAEGLDDLLLAYPCARPDEAATLARLAAAGTTVRATVDCEAHLALLEEAAAAHGATLPVVLDVDASWRPASGALGHYGVRRSPLRSVQAALDLAEALERHPHLRLGGLMLYEAQVAGIADRTRGSRALDPIRGFIKARSVPAVHALRGQLVAALRDRGHALDLVNGGGTGSLRSTAADPAVTEVTVGSGLYCPHLFDGYADLDLRPAAFFALAISRLPDDRHVTCQGGGYLASGASGPDRQPLVHLPAGLRPLSLEGWGEVQTPFDRSRCAVPLAVGDPVLARHAKAGELAERYSTLLLVRGEEIVDRVPTYRGLGLSAG